MKNIRKFFAEHPEKTVRAALCMSGTGSNARVLLNEFEAGKSNYEIAVIFTDVPDGSSAVELSKRYNVPLEVLDIRAFYAEHGESEIKLNTENRRRLRDQWSEEVWKLLKPYQCDFAIFAGFVPLTNLAEKIVCLNVHPGDLTLEEDNRRLYAGLHYEPVEKAILDGRKFLRSSVILVQNYTGNGKKDLDGGPILGVSAPVPVELNFGSLDELRKVKKERKSAPYNDILRKTAAENIENLKINGDHVVLPQTLNRFAAGLYGENEKGELCFLDGEKWVPVKTVEYSSDKEPVIKKAGVVVRSRNRLVRFCKYLYAKMVRETGSPDYIARGWALGMFIGCVVPVFCQLVVAIPLSFVFRGSKIGAALGTFITTPPTAIFIYPIVIWVGNKVINGNVTPEAAENLLKIFNDESLGFAEKWQSFAELGGELIAAFFAGGLLWALIMTPLTYFLVRFLVIRYRRMREKLILRKKKA